MNKHEKLTAAQSLVIIDPDYCMVFGLAEVAFLELLALDALKLEFAEAPGTTEEKTQKVYDLISAGPNLFDDNYDNFQKCFLSPFYENEQLVIRLSNLIKIVNEKIKSRKKLIENLIFAEKAKTYFTWWVKRILSKRIELNMYGLWKQKELYTFFKAYERKDQHYTYYGDYVKSYLLNTYFKEKEIASFKAGVNIDKYRVLNFIKTSFIKGFGSFGTNINPFAIGSEFSPLPTDDQLLDELL